MIRRGLKITLFCCMVAAIGIAFTIAGFVINNNYFQASVTTQEIEKRYERGLNWLVSNEDQLLETHIPALWEMLAKLVNESNNPALEGILQRYRRENQSMYSRNPLKFQVYGTGETSYSSVDLQIFPYYNHLFMYGYSCDDLLSEYLSVQKQLDSKFCNKDHPISPACKTHQLMGFLYFRHNDCLSPKMVEEVIDDLVDDIVFQLTFDFRVVDVYFQRLMLLYESGNEQRINLRWLVHMLRAQNDDGGWDDFMPVLGLAGDRSFGIGARRFLIAEPTSNFHASVQGALVLAYELKRRKASN